MKITIYKKDGKDINIPMPLSAIKSNMFWKVLGLEKEIDLNEAKSSIEEAYNILDQYKKVNGSFTLIDIKEKDNTGVKITI